MNLKAIVETPSMPGEEPEIEAVDLPPRELWAALDNSGEPAAADQIQPQTSPAPASGQAVEAKPAMAELAFIGDRSEVVPLKFPFVWNGQEVREIRINRLTIGQANEILMRPADVKMTNFDIYARMTGLPAAVLRGLDSEDGQAVTDKAYDFLPRSLRTGDD